MHRDPSPHTYAYCSDLCFPGAVAGPYAYTAGFLSCFDSQVFQCGDYPSLDTRYVASYVSSALFQVDKDIADPLARAMISIASAATASMYRKAAWADQLGRIGAGAGGV